MSLRDPHFLIFNAAADSVQDSYEASESLAQFLHVPIEEVHDALAIGYVFSLLDEEKYPTLEQLFQHLTYAESALQRKLASLVHDDGCRIYILIQIEEDYRHELLMAFYGLAAAYSQSFPTLLCMQISENSVPTFQCNFETDIATFLAQQGISPTFHSGPVRENAKT